MISLIFRFITGSLAFVLADYLLFGLWCRTLESALMAGACLMVLYLLVRPIARVVLFAFNVLTLGLIYIALDSTLILVITRLFPGDVRVKDIGWAALAALIINVVRSITGKLVRSH